ncbi:unnamed protein product [Merluccius merluccius]
MSGSDIHTSTPTGRLPQRLGTMSADAGLEKSRVTGPVWCLLLHCVTATSCQLSAVTLAHVNTTLRAV